MCEMDGIAFIEAVFAERFNRDWSGEQTLAELLEATRGLAAEETPGRGPDWDLKGPMTHGDAHEAW